MFDLGQIIVEDVAPAFGIGIFDDDLAVEAAWAEQGCVQRFGQIGGTNGQHRWHVGFFAAQTEGAHHFAVPGGVFGWGVHLQQQLIEQSRAGTAHTHHHICDAAGVGSRSHTSHRARAHQRATACAADGVDFVNEQNTRAVFFGQLACFAIEHHDFDAAHAHEGRGQRRSAQVAERHAGLGRNRLRQIAFAGARRTDEQHATRDFATHLLELLGTLQQRHNAPGGLEYLGVAAVVCKADARLAGAHPVDARARHKEVHQRELEADEYKQIAHRAQQLQNERSELLRGQKLPSRWDHIEQQPDCGDRNGDVLDATAQFVLPTIKHACDAHVERLFGVGGLAVRAIWFDCHRTLQW